MNLIDECRKLISIDSTTSHGSRELVVYAAELCREAGLDVEILSEVHQQREEANLVAVSHESEAPSELLLLSHLDTPDPGGYALWDKTQNNPFQMSIYQDEAFGLGLADAKADFLCKLIAINNVGVKNSKQKLSLVGTFGEASGRTGAMKLLRRKKVRSKRILVGKPTDLKLCTGGQGQAVVEISIPFSDQEMAYQRQHDLAESSSSRTKMFRADDGASPVSLQGNPIIEMIKYVAKLPQGIAILEMDGGSQPTSFPESAFVEMDLVSSMRSSVVNRLTSIVNVAEQLMEEFKQYPSKGFDPPYATLNVGQVRTFQEHIRIYVDCRLPANITSDVYDVWIEKLRMVCHQQGAVFRITTFTHPFDHPSDSAFVQEMQEVLQGNDVPPEIVKMSYSTEANLFRRPDSQCLLFGPGTPNPNGMIANENVRISELEKAVQIYEALIRRICL